MRLSTHFTLDEMTVSETAARMGVDNTPPPDVLEALKHTALGLEGVRTLLGVPIIVTSGYRSPVVNRLVGGAKNSQHMTGQAADFIAPGYGSPRNVAMRISDAGIDFDQCIVEYDRWVHISFTSTPRGEALVIDHSGTRPLFA